MTLLSIAYEHGKGLVQDKVESVKWTYLGAASGNKWCQECVNKNKFSAALTSSDIEEGRMKATDWMQEHSTIFISG